MAVVERASTVSCSLARALAWFRGIDAPVLVHEMRVRQRGTKPFLVTLAYLLVLSLATVLILYFFMGEATRNRSDPQAGLADLGQGTYGAITFLQMIMIVLIVPALSAGAVSGERERKTLDLLSLTLLPSTSIVTQKLAAAIGQVVMLIFASIPVMGVVFLLGGVSPVELVVAYGVLMVTAIFVGSVGMLCSCLLRTSRASTLAAYITVVLFMAGVPIGGEYLMEVSRHGFYSPNGAFPWMMVIGYAFAGAVAALPAFGVVSLLARKKKAWKTRGVRIGAYGASCALMLLILSSPQLLGVTIDSFYVQGVFLPMYTNPFMALYSYMDAQFGNSSSLGTAWWMIGVTVGFGLGCAYLFRHISSAKLADMRRS